MSDIFNLTDTWNNVATVFSAVKMNVTDTASAVGSKLIDLQVAGTSKFNVSKDGNNLYLRQGDVGFNGSIYFGDINMLFGYASAFGTQVLTCGATNGFKAVSLTTTPATFATLSAIPLAGMRSYITDCNTAVFNAVAGGGGANKVPVFHDGINWKVG